MDWPDRELRVLRPYGLPTLSSFGPRKWPSGLIRALSVVVPGSAQAPNRTARPDERVPTGSPSGPVSPPACDHHGPGAGATHGLS